MPRPARLTCLALLLAAAACRPADAARDVIPPPAEVPAPDRLTRPGVAEPPAPAPTAAGTYASMTPPFMQRTPPRPRTRTSAPRADSATRVAAPRP